MDELIKISVTPGGKQAVSAKELYDFLGFEKSQWSRWCKKNIVNNPYAEVNKDWQGFDIKSNGNITKDFILTLDFGKRLSMLARTQKGELIRGYFIACEKRLREVAAPQLPSAKQLAQMVIDAENEKEKVQLLLNDANKTIEENKPKIVFADSVSVSSDAILIGELAKILKQNEVDMGQNRLFKWMRENGYLIRRNGTDYNMPTQYAMEKRLFKIKETSIAHSDGRVTISKTAKLTGIGQQYFINKFLNPH